MSAVVRIVAGSYVRAAQVAINAGLPVHGWIYITNADQLRGQSGVRVLVEEGWTDDGILSVSTRLAIAREIELRQSLGQITVEYR